MKVLFQGIYNLFNAGSDLKTNTSSQLYPHEADQENASFPYVVYSLVNDLSDWTFTEDFEEITVQFSIFSEKNSAIECLDLLENLKTLYDDATLTVSGYTSVFMHRESGQLIRDEQQNVWQYVVDYNILLEKARS